MKLLIFYCNQYSLLVVEIIVYAVLIKPCKSISGD